MIMYLNTNWQPADGGQLRIHQSTGEQNIEPLNGKSDFLKAASWCMRCVACQ